MNFRPAGATMVEYVNGGARNYASPMAGATENRAAPKIGRPTVRIPPQILTSYANSQLGRRSMLRPANALRLVRPAGDTIPNPFDITGLGSTEAQNVAFGADSGGDKSGGSFNGGAPMSGTDIAALITAIGQVGIGVANTVLGQMNRDQVMQLQRDLINRQQSLGGTPETRASIEAALAAANQRARTLEQSTGMSSTTLVLIAALGLGALYVISQKRSRHNPVVGHGRSRHYVKPGRKHRRSRRRSR